MINNKLLPVLIKIVKFHNDINKCCVFLNRASIDELSSENIIIVPTIDEAKNFLRIEMIQRDLSNQK